LLVIGSSKGRAVFLGAGARFGWSDRADDEFRRPIAIGSL
jgi:hypothetical protein